MKTRNFFVSNSSAASFIVPLKRLTPREIQVIMDPIPFAKIINHDGLQYTGDYTEWTIEIHGDKIIGHTSMDNFDMKGFFDKLGIRVQVESDGG